MHQRVIPLGLILSAAAVASLPVPASGATQVRPRAGSFSGQEADGADPLPVTFTVPKSGKRLLGFSGQAVAKAGCKYYITSFAAPKTPIQVKKNGHFTSSSTNYPPPPKRHNVVTVTVNGTFTSPGAAHGHISVRISKIKGCNASRPFTVQRTP